MSERAHADRGGLIAVAVVGSVLAVVTLIAGQIAKELPNHGAELVVCNGLCGCGACPPSFYALPVITALVILASYVISVPEELPSSEDGDEP